MLYDLIVIGAGISGLTSARIAADKGLENVLLLDYQNTIGGYTQAYWQDETFAKEQELLKQAEGLPYEIRSQSTVVGFFPGEPHQLYVQSPEGTYSVESKRVLIASGALEKPREAHRIPGSRPAGVMTPMMAMQLLERGYKPGKQVVLMGSGRIVNSAATLLKDKVDEIAIYSTSEWGMTGISGFSRVESIKLHHLQQGTTHEQTCDTLIFAKGRIPSTFFLKGTPILRNYEDAIVIDEQGRTNFPEVFATGSCTMLGDDDHMNSIALAEHTMNHLLKTL